MARSNRRKEILSDSLKDYLGSDFFDASKGDYNPQFVADCYLYGGKKFVDAIKMYGVNEREEKLNLLPWNLEYAELIGDFRVAETLTSGCAQVGKTLTHTLLICYCLTEGRINVLWSYDKQVSRDVQVPSNFRPVIEYWMKSRGVKNLSNDAKNNSIYQFNGATVQFVYVSTSKVKTDNSGKAAADGIAVGVSRDLLVEEERSQYPPGASDPLKRRLDAGRLPSRPVRQLGTPGSGNGIEAEVERADYIFYPHYHCPICGKSAVMHPKGCLLRGEFLSATGRPIDWFHDENGAFFGCSHCGAKLSDKTRSQTWFRCTITGIDLREFLDSLPKEEPKKRITAAIILSPLLRFRSTNLAQEMIDEGLKTLNTDDFQQQVLGEASVSSNDSVTLKMLKDAIARDSPQRRPDFTICGIDQGRNEYWLVKTAYYLPQGWENLPVSLQVESAYREVLIGQDIVKGEIEPVIFDCDFGIIDAEPDISAAVDLAARTCLELADQQAGMLDAVKGGIVREGGNEHPCWKIRNEKFLKAVLQGYLTETWILPSEWQEWIATPTERSPLVHLCAPKYDARTGKWIRPKNHVDDLYYASMFCEAGFYIWLTNKSKKSGFDLWRQVVRKNSKKASF